MISVEINPESLYQYKSKIKLFLHKHGLNYELFRDNLVQKMKKENSICTSGIPTFLDVLSKENQKILKISDPNKIFNVNITLKYMDTQLEKKYNQEKDEIREKYYKKKDFDNFDNLLNEFEKIPKPNEYKKKYNLNFNLNDKDFDDLKKEFLECVDNFYNIILELEENNYFTKNKK